MPTACLHFRTPDVHDALGRALRFIRVAKIGVVRVNVERLPEHYSVDISIFDESTEALHLLARRLEGVIEVLDLDFKVRPADSCHE
jgi:hypothetical protein